jgi:hypothetical protein
MMFPVGSLVTCHIPGHEGNSSEPSIVIGHMSYGPEVACLATERYHGCPVNEAHLTLVGQADEAEAQRLRQRYLDAYGETRFVALPAKENTNG